MSGTLKQTDTETRGGMGWIVFAVVLCAFALLIGAWIFFFWIAANNRVADVPLGADEVLLIEHSENNQQDVNSASSDSGGGSAPVAESGSARKGTAVPQSTSVQSAPEEGRASVPEEVPAP